MSKNLAFVLLDLLPTVLVPLSGVTASTGTLSWESRGVIYAIPVSCYRGLHLFQSSFDIIVVMSSADCLRSTALSIRRTLVYNM